MEISLLSTLAFGFILGIKHAIEPDHVIAVSTIASGSKKLWRSSLAGVFWGIGHTATLFIVGLVLILMKSMLVGLVHGLAGSAAMTLLTMSTVKSVWEGAVYILVFGVGTVVGMLLFTTVIGIPFVISAKKIKINKALTQITGVISTAFGFYYMYNLGITEELFKLWIQ